MSYISFWFLQTFWVLLLFTFLFHRATTKQQTKMSKTIDCLCLFLILLATFKVQCFEDQLESVPMTSKDDNDDHSTAGKSFQCLDGHHIPESKYCDYIVDCPDGSDESSCGTCDFATSSGPVSETGINELCGWKSDQQWKMVDQQYLTTMPAQKADTKKMLQISNLPHFNKNCFLVLSLAIITKSPESKTYLDVEFSGTLSSLAYNAMRITLSEVKAFNQTLGQVLLELNTYRHAELNINITAALEDVGDEIRIGSIGFRNCNPHRTVLDCTFEEVVAGCDWQATGAGTWETISAYPELDHTLPFYSFIPTADHTLGADGHFTIATFQKTEKPDNLTSLPIKMSGCLSFYYYFDGSSSLSLMVVMIDKISNRETVLDTTLAKSFGSWTLKQFYIHAPGYHSGQFLTMYHNYEIRFMAVVAEPSGVIALDDIAFRYGKCPTSMCTFEYGACDYSVAPIALPSAWHVVNGVWLQSNTSLITTDHTLDSVEGHFMAFIPRRKGDRNWFDSPTFQFEAERCLRLYYLISDADVATIEVAYNANNQQKTLAKRSHDTIVRGSPWTLLQVELPPIDNLDFEVIATAGGNVNGGYVAVDDISVTNDRCKALVDCDFESNWCGWALNDAASTGVIERRNAVHNKTGHCTLPPKDHTWQGPNGHFLFFCYNEQSVFDIPLLQSVAFDSKRDYCLSFWVYFVGEAQLELDVYLLKDEPSLDPLAKIGLKDVKPDQWTYQQINIAGAKDAAFDVYNLQMIFRHVIADQVYDSMAIDDIKLAPFGCGYKPPDNHNNNGHNQTTVASELRKFRCTFETGEGFCDYNAVGVGHFEWTNVGVKEDLMGTPQRDHTTDSTIGRFLMLTRKKGGGEDARRNYAQLVTKDVISPYTSLANQSFYQVCVDFWYIMNGESPNQLDVGVSPPNTTQVNIVSTLRGTFGPNWRHRAISINVFDDFLLYFRGTTFGADGVLALDDIKVFAGACPIEVDGVCDLSVDACGWSNNASSPLTWTLGNGYQAEFVVDNTIIPIDHTTGTQYGNYLYINASDPSTSGQSGQLISPTVKPDRKCLQFWYYLYGNNVGALSVYIVYSRRLNVRYQLSSEVNADRAGWLLAQVSIDKHYYDQDFQFVIELQRSLDVSSTFRVAIDDLDILEECQPLGSCDFEEDFCVYGNPITNRTDLSLWARGSAPVSKLGPRSGRTGSKAGVFAYLAKGPQGILQTSEFRTQAMESVNCLSFYYFLNGKTVYPQLNVTSTTLVASSNQWSEQIVATFEAHKATAGVWSLHESSVVLKAGVHQIQFLGIVDKEGEIIALDDISFRPGDCRIPQGKFACDKNITKTTQYVRANQVCDFKKDCASGLDEAHCGTECHFTSGLCDWTIKNVTSTFQSATAHHGKYLGDFSSYLQLYDRPGVFVDHPEAIFESPWLQNSSSYCMIRLYFYQYDPDDNAARLTIKFIEPDNPEGIEVFIAEGNQGASWNLIYINLNRIAGRFKIQINARLNIRKGGGVVAIANLYLLTCGFPRESSIHCGLGSANKFPCQNNKKHCYSASMRCDFQDDCGDGGKGGDEDTAMCDLGRGLRRCSFEQGLCDWTLPTFVNQTHLNGFLWDQVANVADYPYGLKRDHTRNNEFGHFVYLWNRQKLIGRLESAFLAVNAHDPSGCVVRFYYAYRSRYTPMIFIDSKRNIGRLNIYLRFGRKSPPKLFKTINQIESYHFEQHEFSVTFLEGKAFSVLFEIVPGNDTNGMWAIDDISYQSGCLLANASQIPSDSTFTPLPTLAPTTPGPEQCTSTQFECDKLFCINRTQVCDFTQDCVDASDEKGCAYNTLDVGWRDVGQSRFHWILKNGTARGVLIGTGLGDKAVLRSKPFGISADQCLMAFDYYVEFPSGEK